VGHVNDVEVESPGGGTSEDVRLMLKRCIDPLATDEPYEALPKM
jgi:hypothetical protein